MLYPSFCQYPLAMMSCQGIHPEAYDGKGDENAALIKDPQPWMTQTYLRVDPEEECHGTNHTWWVMLLALPSFVVYAIGLPLTSFLILWRQREYHKSKKYMFRMGLLYSGYSKKRWWWECVVVLRKLSVILIVSFFYSDGLQLQITLGMIVAAYALHHIYMPFGDHLGGHYRLLHVLERNSILVSIVLLWSATVFLVHPNCENAFCYMLVVVTLISNIVFLGYGCVTFVQSFLEHTKIVKHIKHKMKYIENPFRNTGMSLATVKGRRKSKVPHQALRVDGARKGSASAGAEEEEGGGGGGGGGGGSGLELAGMSSSDGRDENVTVASTQSGARSTTNKRKQFISTETRAQYATCDGRKFNEYHTDDGLAFYVSVDGATNTWVLPEGAVLTAAAAAAARYWQYETNDGRQFWVTEDGSESVWELPAGVTVIGAGEVASQGPVV